MGYVMHLPIYLCLFSFLWVYFGMKPIAMSGMFLDAKGTFDKDTVQNTVIRQVKVQVQIQQLLLCLHFCFYAVFSACICNRRLSLTSTA